MNKDGPLNIKPLDNGALPDGSGRVIIENIWPEIDGGRTPIKRVMGEAIEVWADIFSDGHDIIAAEILYRAEDEKDWRRVPMSFVDNDRWKGAFKVEKNARYFYTIEAWRDVFGSWVSEVQKKKMAGQNVASEIKEGLGLIENAAKTAKSLDKILAKAKKAEAGSDAQFNALTDPFTAKAIADAAGRANVSRFDRELVVISNRVAARYSSWYELFPRSMSDDP
jgi:starch synthase (maltosyl-transferring)